MKRPVRTRMQGGVGAAGGKPVATRFIEISTFLIFHSEYKFFILIH